MVDLENRLGRCFLSVFPELTVEQIRYVSTETVLPWDSLTVVTLVSVLEQEFGVQINPLDLAELNSYYAMKNYLENRLSHS